MRKIKNVKINLNNHYSYFFYNNIQFYTATVLYRFLSIHNRENTNKHNNNMAKKVTKRNEHAGKEN